MVHKKLGVILILREMFAQQHKFRYESSTLILYKELSSRIFQSQWVSESVSQASVTPVQISTFCNI